MSWLRLAILAAIGATVAFCAWAVIERADLAEQLDALHVKVAACDTAIADDDLYSVRSSCSAAVKALAAERDAAASSLASANAALATATIDRDAAIVRAEARAAEAAQRNLTNDRTIDAAQRLADGRVHCDAQCLRALAGDAAGR